MDPSLCSRGGGSPSTPVMHREGIVGALVAKSCCDLLEQYHAPTEQVKDVLTLLEASADLTWCQVDYPPPK